MKILLINPPYKWEDSKAGEGVLPPLGLLYIAAVLLENDYEVDLLDSRALSLSKEEVEKEVALKKPDVVGISSMTFNISEAYDVAEIVKKVDGNIKVMIGGAHPTALPTETLEECKDIDITVYGEGEITVPELMEAIEGKRKMEDIEGIAYRDAANIMKNAPRPLIEDLDSVPFPARQLLPWEKYQRLTHRTLFSKNVDKPYTTMMTSRGCPFGCVYCDKSAFGRKWRARSAENVVAEIEAVVEKYNIGEVSFHDDLFTLDRERVVKICELILEKGISISWACDARADTVDQEMLDLMKRSGCTTVCFGVESGDQTILDNIKKSESLEQIRDAVTMAKKAGLNVSAGFIFGLPGETLETAKATLEFAKSLNVDIAIFNIATPFPGSPLFKQLEKENRILTRDWSKYNPHLSEMVYVHENLSPEIIEKLHSDAYKSYYTRPKYIFSKAGDAIRNPTGFLRAGLVFSKMLLKKAK